MSKHKHTEEELQEMAQEEQAPQETEDTYKEDVPPSQLRDLRTFRSRRHHASHRALFSSDLCSPIQ